MVAKPSFAQTNDLASPNLAPGVPQNLHTLTQSVFIEILSTIGCQLTGIDITSSNGKCLGVNTKTGQIGYAKNGGGGLLGIAGNAITMLYITPPASTSDYVHYLTDHFGIAGHAYAQTTGYGYNSLKPLLPLWIAFRNITYLFVIIILVAIGIAIMLRIKIDPRTVMTIENQLPKVIIGLILITFSFAIAGFLIDLMYLFMYLGVNIIAQADKGLAIDLAKITGKTAFGVANELFPAAGPQVGPVQFGGLIGIILSVTGAFKDIIGSLLSGTFVGPIVAALLLAVSSFLTGPVGIAGAIVCSAGSFLGGLLGDKGIPVLSGIGAGIGGVCGQVGVGLIDIAAAVIVFLIASIALLITLVRVWFALLKAYIFTLFNIVLAPFYFFFGMLPGSPLGFDTWFKDMIANLSAFPVTLLFLLIGSYFMRNFKAAPGLFVPPFVGGLGTDYGANINGTPLGFGAQAGTSGIGTLIGFGVILLTPQVINMTRALVKAPENKFTSAIGQALGAGAGAAQRIGSGTFNTLFGEYTTIKPGQGIVKDESLISRALKSAGIKRG